MDVTSCLRAQTSVLRNSFVQCLSLVRIANSRNKNFPSYSCPSLLMIILYFEVIQRLLSRTLALSYIKSSCVHCRCCIYCGALQSAKTSWRLTSTCSEILWFQSLILCSWKCCVLERVTRAPLSIRLAIAEWVLYFSDSLWIPYISALDVNCPHLPDHLFVASLWAISNLDVYSLQMTSPILVSVDCTCIIFGRLAKGGV